MRPGLVHGLINAGRDRGVATGPAVLPLNRAWNECGRNVADFERLQRRPCVDPPVGNPSGRLEPARKQVANRSSEARHCETLGLGYLDAVWQAPPGGVAVWH